MNRRFKSMLIEVGTSLNGFYYSADVLREATSLVKPATKMYIDHRVSRTIIDLAGIIVGKSEFIEPNLNSVGGILADVLILNEELLQIAQETPCKVGISINATGDVLFQNGRKIIICLKSFESIDFVDEPSAGGKLLVSIDNIGHLLNKEDN